MNFFKGKNSISKKKIFIDFDLKSKKIFLIDSYTIKKNFFINGKVYSLSLIEPFIKLKKFTKFHNSISFLDLCVNLNYFIPHYCFHHNLSIAGNCRMCLIELESSQKPIASCAMEINENFNINLNSFLTLRAREGILEFLLINHPLDCPVCDQGGECDLQDENLSYGNDRGRFSTEKDLKRSLTDFFFNNIIKVILTRCIFCTRCVRFLREIQGNKSFGLFGRGSISEIGYYKNTTKFSAGELSGMIIDFCPVGALTSKYYAFKYRAWEELYIESIDISDSLCSSIRVYSNLKNISRILPQYNTDLEIQWIHDKSRFIYDSFKTQSLDNPKIKSNSNLLLSYLKGEKRSFSFVRIKWESLSEVLNLLIRNINIPIGFLEEENYIILPKDSKKSLIKGIEEEYFGNYSLKTFVGNLLDINSLLRLKELSHIVGSINLYNCTEKNLVYENSFLNEDFDKNYIFNCKNFNVYKNFFLINLNLRVENPLINAKLRQKVVWDLDTKIFFLGNRYNLSYKYVHIGTTTKIFLKILEGRHFFFNFLTSDLKKNKTKNNLLIYSSDLKSLYKNSYYRLFFNYLRYLTKFFEVLYLVKGANSLGGLDLNLGRSIIKKKTTNNFSYSSKKVFMKEKNNIKEPLYYFVGFNERLLDSLTFLNLYNHSVSIYQNYFGDPFFFLRIFYCQLILILIKHNFHQ